MASSLLQTLPQATKNGYRRIVSLDYEIMVDMIIVILGITWYKTGNDPLKTEVILIDHSDMHSWLDDQEMLFEDSGEIDDPKRYPVAYTDYIQSGICKSDIKEYIKTQKLAEGHEW
jgi:hypothetical protein